MSEPNLDADLLGKLGSEDPEFLNWLNEFDSKPLLNEALKRALSNVSAKGVVFSINADGMLEAKGNYSNTKEKNSITDIISRVSERWQFEILGIVTELLDYTFTIIKSDGELILEAEEKGKSHPCDYIKVTKRGGEASLVFEHFKSRRDLDVETAKFLALAEKLGVKISISESNVSEGDAFPTEQRHSHSHGHHHHGDNHGHDHDHEE